MSSPELIWEGDDYSHIFSLSPSNNFFDTGLFDYDDDLNDIPSFEFSFDNLGLSHLSFFHDEELFPDSEGDSSKHKWVHDVFLSFKGEDTRNNFVSHLNSALRNAGIHTFIDYQLPRGEQISSELVNAIEGSNCALVVLSQNYASSKWCLNELVQIIDCQKTFGQIVLPIFYHVDPSDVSNQTGPYASAFARLGNKLGRESHHYVQRWKAALSEIRRVAGWHIKDESNESELITMIVKEVFKRLDRAHLHVADYPVGIECRVQEVINQSLSKESLDVRMVGILGMGGIGKTTIAKAIYNTMAHNFDAGSFLENIREVCNQDNGLVYFQELLILGISGESHKIPNVDRGKNLMNERLRHKKAIVVLDDVDKLSQLSALCRRDWFGPGSVIIITTRNERLLKVHQVDHVYPMSEMDDNESLELFSWHAFKKASPAEGFIELSRKVISYCGRLPLALQVLGSYLFDEKEMRVWESVLSKLERIPNNEVQEKLKISFDGLSDDKVKDIFLDICCFFIGMDREYVTQILNGCELYAESGITVLLERSLLKVGRYNKLNMHDLLRDMGREIIRENFPKEPEKRSRLWLYEDVVDVLKEHMGTSAIEGLALKFPRINGECLSTEAFKEMKRLRLLQMDRVQLIGDYTHLSKRLRWLCWHRFSLRYMPANFYQKGLVAIDLKYSNLKLVWKEPQLLEKLKILNLSHSLYLIRTPDFTKLPNLEKLILKHCPRLIMVHQSIGELQNLLLVNLKDCKCLKDLPRSIYKVKSLKTLIISGCSLIDKLEEDIEQMESLTHLAADNSTIVQVPFSLARSKSIGYISLCGYEGRARDVLPSIIWSWMPPSNIFRSLTQSFGSNSSLVSLKLQGDDFHGLSQIVTTIPKLRSLGVTCDSNVQQTQDIAVARNCVEFETAPNSSQISNLETSAEVSLRSLMIQMGGCNKIVDTLVESIQLIWATGKFDHCFPPSDKYPDWFVYKGEGSSVTLKVPQDIGCILKGMTLCVAYFCSLDNLISQFLVSIWIINRTKNTFQHHQQDSATSFEYEKWRQIVSNLEPGNEVEIIVNIGHKCAVKEVTAYLVYGDSDYLTESSKRHIDRPDTIYTKEGKKKRKL